MSELCVALCAQLSVSMELQTVVVVVCVCVCVCVCALVWTDIWGQFCDFNRISADTRGVGTSTVVRPMPINVLSIFKHIYIVNAIF